MIAFGICDDERVYADIIATKIKDVMNGQHIEYTVKKFLSATEFLTRTEKIDILFLDIKLDDGADGIEIGKELRNRDDSPLLILVSSHSTFVFDGYETDALRFVRKPIQDDDIYFAIEKALAEMQNSQERLKISYKQAIHYIPVQSIYYIDRYLRRRRIHAVDGEYTTNEKWSDIIAQLPSYQFVEVQRSYCVNLRKIREVRNNKVTLTNGVEISISRDKKVSFDKALYKFGGGNRRI